MNSSNIVSDSHTHTDSSNSNETLLESFIDKQLSTIPYDIRRQMEWIKGLDSTCIHDFRQLQQLQNEFIANVEEKILQLEVVEMEKDDNEDDDDNEEEDRNGKIRGNDDEHHDDDGGSNSGVSQNKKRKCYYYGVRAIRPNENNNNDDSNGNSNNGNDDTKQQPPVVIPTTAELMEYVTTNTTTTTMNDDNENDDDDNEQASSASASHYRQIQQLQQSCLQKAAEKIAVAQQTYDILNTKIEHLDNDLLAMEQLLQATGEFQTGTIAKPDDLAACQVTPGSEWILAKVVHHDPMSGMYKLSDEDVESNKIFDLPDQQVILLSGLNERLSKGDTIFAVYPDTTSFYPATVVQAPRKMGQFVMVNFVDDSDEFGITHDKAVPIQHVMPPPS